VTFKGKYCVYHTFLRIYLVKKVPYLWKLLKSFFGTLQPSAKGP
jgi:hypothetical protein